MNLDKTCTLFIGVKIDSKLRDALANAKPSVRRYFEDGNSEFLQICEAGENQKWIGKVVKGGFNVSAVEDIQRNVLSILRRIAVGTRISPSSLKIFAIAKDPPEPARPSGSGPYISNY